MPRKQVHAYRPRPVLLCVLAALNGFNYYQSQSFPTPARPGNLTYGCFLRFALCQSFRNNQYARCDIMNGVIMNGVNSVIRCVRGSRGMHGRHSAQVLRMQNEIKPWRKQRRLLAVPSSMRAAHSLNIVQLESAIQWVSHHTQLVAAPTP